MCSLFSNYEFHNIHYRIHLKTFTYDEVVKNINIDIIRFRRIGKGDVQITGRHQKDKRNFNGCKLYNTYFREYWNEKTQYLYFRFWMKQGITFLKSNIRDRSEWKQIYDRQKIEKLVCSGIFIIRTWGTYI